MDLQETIEFNPETKTRNIDRKYFINEKKGVFIKVDENIDRGKNEARILSKIKHPNIQEFVESNVFKSKHYLKTRYYNAKSLENMTISKSDLQNIESQLFNVFSYLIKEGVCHNDINVSNLLYDGGNLKIIDWETASLGDSIVDLFGPPTSTNH